MALDYRYVVGRKKMRDAKTHCLPESFMPEKKLFRVVVKSTGAEGLAESITDIGSLPPESPVVVSFGCHGQKKYIRSALDIMNV